VEKDTVPEKKKNPPAKKTAKEKRPQNTKGKTPRTEKLQQKKEYEKAPSVSDQSVL